MSINPAGAVPEFDLADRLKKSREFAGLGQAELAERMGVSRGTVSNAERAQHGVRPIVVKMWAMATGVSLQWLETGKAPVDGPGPDLRARRDSNSQPSGLESDSVEAQILEFPVPPVVDTEEVAA